MAASRRASRSMAPSAPSTVTNNSGGSDIRFSSSLVGVYPDLAEGSHYATLGGAAFGGGVAYWTGPATAGVPTVTLTVESVG